MLKSERDKTLLKIARKFYQESLSKTDIAHDLRISVTHVNRMLQEANDRGIVQISISAPRFEDLEFALAQKYHLKEARVVDYTEDEAYLRIDLGQAGATYFEEKVTDGDKVGIGSGQTIYQTISHILEKPRRIEIYPLNVMTQRDLKVVSVEANSLANTLWFKSRPTAQAFKVELFFPGEDMGTITHKIGELIKSAPITTFLEQLTKLDYYFFSVSELRSDSAMVTLADEMGIGFEGLQAKGIIGDCIFNAIDKKGNGVKFGSEKLTIGLSIDDLEAIRHETGEVVCIAGGLRKVKALKVVLNRGFINVLITDREVATLLVK